MQVKLKVMRGAHAGREVLVPVAKFLIGRGEECHLRPRSEAVSREHCVIVAEKKHVTVQDLGSKNGTFVNGEPIKGVQVVQTGDQLQIGPLLFEIVINHVLGGVKRPVVRDVKEAAARTASSNTEDLDITKWLEEDEDDDSAISKAVASPETRQFRLDDTSNLALETQVGQDEVDLDVDEVSDDEQGADEKDKKSKRWKKDNPGKLPKGPQISAKDSREAAADMLKKFFNRR